jgi:tetratricopeptide (TPR) repeat protein
MMLMYHLGLAHMQAREFHDAATHFAEVLEMVGHEPPRSACQPLWQRYQRLCAEAEAACLLLTKEKADARGAIEDRLKKKSDKLHPYTLMRRVCESEGPLRRMKHFVESEQILSFYRELAEEFDSEEALGVWANNSGVLRARAGRYDEAARLIRRATEIDERLKPINVGNQMLNLAECLIGLGRTEEAAALLDQALERIRVDGGMRDSDPRRLKVPRSRALLAEAEGNRDCASAEATKLLDLIERSPYVFEDLQLCRRLGVLRS